MTRLAILASFVVAAPAWVLAQSGVKISDEGTNDAGIRRFAVQSPYQAGTTHVRVLVPDKHQDGQTHRVLFVLPVEAGEEHRYGDGLAEVQRLGLHNRHDLVCVDPTFSHLPWYADHPTDPEIRQERYFIEVVLPLVVERLPVKSGAENSLLLGFSKSGWGAWSLLLRHPDRFSRAAAWDAPLAMVSPTKYGMQIVFATQENFEPYQITTALERNIAHLKAPARLGLFGYGNFRDQHVTVHDRLVELGIPHEYRDGPKREHAWSSGWVTEAVEWLVAPE